MVQRDVSRVEDGDQGEVCVNQYGLWLKVPQKWPRDGRWGVGGHSVATPPHHGRVAMRMIRGATRSKYGVGLRTDVAKKGVIGEERSTASPI